MKRDHCTKSVIPHRLLVPIITVSLVLGLAGCATTTGVRSDNEVSSVYQELQTALATGECDLARQHLAVLEAGDPENSDLPRTYLDVAYGCLQAGEHSVSGEVSEAFLQRYTDHGSRDYAQYLYALSAYGEWKTNSRDLQPAEREALAREAFSRFQTLVRNSADTDYRDDVRPAVVELREGLARAELELIRTKLETGAYEGVIARANYLLRYYGSTESAPYAAGALVTAYRARDENALARKALTQLEAKWPEHPVLRTLE